MFAEQLDTDGDGLLGPREVMTLALLLNNSVRPDDAGLANLTSNLTAASFRAGEAGKLTATALLADPYVQEKLAARVGKTKKYKYSLENLDQVDFYMVPDDYDAVQRRLDEIRTQGHKFICLNDDMNKTHDPDPRLLHALSDFYQAYFPLPCPFELPDDAPNAFLTLDELRSAQWPWQRLWVDVQKEYMHLPSASRACGQAASWLQRWIGDVNSMWLRPVLSLSPLTICILVLCVAVWRVLTG